MELSTIPLLDHHCHSLRRPGVPLDGPAFRDHFTESNDPQMMSHIAFSFFYRRGIWDLASVLDCASTEEAILAYRQKTPPDEYAQKLFQAANISSLLVDTGFRGAENYRLEEQREFLPCTIWEVLRLETLMEELVLQSESFAELEEAYRLHLSNVRERGIVALKSIAAYRGGLQIETHSRNEALQRFDALKIQARRDGRLRLVDRPVLEYLLRIALEESARQELPVQFHTGFGDSDADLRTANPLHLRSLLMDPALNEVRFVLLHTYPFMREAGYLASLYSNVYLDLSLTIPFASHGGTPALLEALELAPVSKVLLSTDAFSIPELFYLGALNCRRCLEEAFHNLIERQWLKPYEVSEMAQRLLYRNAQGVYGLQG